MAKEVGRRLLYRLEAGYPIICDAASSAAMAMAMARWFLYVIASKIPQVSLSALFHLLAEYHYRYPLT